MRMEQIKNIEAPADDAMLLVELAKVPSAMGGYMQFGLANAQGLIYRKIAVNGLKQGDAVARVLSAFGYREDPSKLPPGFDLVFTKSATP